MNDDQKFAAPTLTQAEKLQVLLVEYGAMREELRMYVKEYSPKLTVLGTVLAAAFALAAQRKDNWQGIVVCLPPIVLLLGHITIAQSYLVAAVASRARHIEQEINALNGGKELLKWECIYAPRLVGDLFVGRSWNLNPIHTSVALIICFGVILVVYGIWAGIPVLAEHSPLGALLYYIFVILALILELFQSWTFFRTGKIVAEMVNVTVSRTDDPARPAKYM